MRVYLHLQSRPGEAREEARRLVEVGADGLFTFEGPHDVFFPLVEAAPAVDVDLLTNVAIAIPRSPLHLAHAAYDLQTLSRGRFLLGVGSQVKPHIEGRYGATWTRPAARMREHVQATKAILEHWQHGTPLDFRGEFTRHTLMPPMFVPGPSEHGVPPVLMGALGPVMTRTAAEVADGLLAFYGSTPAYRPVLEVEGRGELQPRLNQLSKQGALAEMTGLVDDAMLATLAVRGTPEQCAAEIQRRFGQHADRVCAYFPGYDVAAEHLRDLVAALRAP